MECDGNTQKVVITNQDKAPVRVKFASGEVYEAAAAQLDTKTGVYVPTTSAQCVPTASGDMTLQYTQGDKCVHRRFPEGRWAAAQMGDEGAFYYTVPSWNFGDPAEVCMDAPANANTPDAGGEDAPRGAGNAAWWNWFWPRECIRASAAHPWEFWLMLAGVALLLLLAAWYWRSATCYVEPGCPAAADLKAMLAQPIKRG